MNGEILTDMYLELFSAFEKFPKWPTDTFHALAVVNEKIGELNKAVLQFYYEPEKMASSKDIKMEALQSMAMLYRFLVSLNDYNYGVNLLDQHFQYVDFLGETRW
jgi:hypothetical protein